MNRRDLLVSVAGAFAWNIPKFITGFPGKGREPRMPAIPLVHITDLYHPPQDPDDHIDLATVAALGEYDLKAVILDNTRKFMLAAPEGFDIRREPGFVPVSQLGRLLGRSIPVAAGPALPLVRPDDDVSERPPAEQAGVDLLLSILEESPDSVAVSVVGSARVLTAAYNRRQDLLHSKIRFVLLNAGSLAGPKREWNVGLDPQAYIGLWKSGLPIRWYPCATDQGAFQPDHDRGTFWKTTHAKIFRELAPPLRTWFTEALSHEAAGDTVQAPLWDRILKAERNMWSTASLVMGAGRVLARTPGGWRFLPEAKMQGEPVWKWRLDPIEAKVDADADVRWQLAGKGGNAFLFGRQKGNEFGQAMGEALGALLGTLHAR